MSWPPREPEKSFQSFCVVLLFKEYCEFYIGFGGCALAYGDDFYCFRLSCVAEPELPFTLLEVFGEEFMLEVN